MSFNAVKLSYLAESWHDTLIAYYEERLMDPAFAGRIHAMPQATLFAVSLLNFRRSVVQLSRLLNSQQIRDGLGAFEGRVPLYTMERIRNVLNYLHAYTIGEGRDRQEGDSDTDWELQFREDWNDLAARDKRDVTLIVGKHELRGSDVVAAVRALQEIVVDARAKLLEDHRTRSSAT